MTGKGQHARGESEQHGETAGEEIAGTEEQTAAQDGVGDAGFANQILGDALGFEDREGGGAAGG